MKRYAFFIAIPACVLALEVGLPQQAAGADYPGVNDVIFNEIMVAPLESSDEWVELYNRSGVTENLTGCVLHEGTSGTCEELQDNEDYAAGHCFVLGKDQPMEISAGQYLVLGKNDHLSNDCKTTLDDQYTTLSWNNSTETVTLFCPNPDEGGALRIVASLTYPGGELAKWNAEDGYNKGRSWMLSPERMTSDYPSEPDYWCVADPDLDGVHACPPGGGESEETTEYHTAGEANVCHPLTPYPEPGQLVITEINAGEGDTEKWIELHYPAGTQGDEVTLEGCSIRGIKCSAVAEGTECIDVDFDPEDSEATPPPTPSKTDLAIPSNAPAGAVGQTLSPGDYITLAGTSTTTCISVDPENPENCLVAPAYTFAASTAGLYMSDRRLLELVCPGNENPNELELIDRVVFEGDVFSEECTRADGGCSWETTADVLIAPKPDEANDVDDAWVPAGSKAVYYAGVESGTSNLMEAYGTPGAANLYGPESPIPVGGVAFLEVSSWASGKPAPDWAELGVIDHPGDDTLYRLGECQIRTSRCDDATSIDECLEVVDPTLDVEAITALGTDALNLGDGGLALVVADDTDTCVAAAPGTSGECAVEGQGYAKSLDISKTSGTFLMELLCPDEVGHSRMVDQILYSGTWIESTCIEADARCSWELRPDKRNATDNDDVMVWATSRDAYIEPGLTQVTGTPGSLETRLANARTTTRPPKEGELAFSEQMIAPESGPEWSELKYVEDSSGGSSAFELAGCELVLVKSENVEDTALCDPGLGDERSGTLCTAYRFSSTVSLTVGPEERLLLMKGTDDYGACLSRGLVSTSEDSPTPSLVPEVVECQIMADSTYKSVDASTSSNQYLTLWCPSGENEWALIDEFYNDWDTVGSSCQTSVSEETTSTPTPEATPAEEKGRAVATSQGCTEAPAACSVGVYEEYINRVDNDDPFYRCVSPCGDDGETDYPTFYDVGGNLTTGSPGAANECGSLPNPPPEDALAIQEVMIAPAGDDANEWFETVNLNDESYDFRTCSLELQSPSSDGEDEVNAEKISAYSLQNSGASIGPNERQLWVNGPCLVEGEDGCIDVDDGDEGTGIADVTYKLTFPNSSGKYLRIRCDGPGGTSWVVDEIYFNGDALGIETGQSYQLDPAYKDVVEDYDPTHWCRAGLSEKYRYYCGADGVGNHGTPGRDNECPVIDCGDDCAPSCRCSMGVAGGGANGAGTSGSGEPPGAGTWGWLFVGVFLVLRRRPSDGRP